MKRCPSCNRSYTDASLNFCLEDGTPLVVDAPPPSDPNATMQYPSARETSEPTPTEIYRPDTLASPATAMATNANSDSEKEVECDLVDSRGSRSARDHRDRPGGDDHCHSQHE